MSDQLIELLRERFHGHEMDVPPGVWEQVTGQMAANSGEGLRESLQDKFQGHEVQVDPSAWAHINAQIGSGAAAGSSAYMGWIAAGVAAVVLTAGVFLWNNQTTETASLVTNGPQVSLNEVRVTESTPTVVPSEPTVASPRLTVEEQAPKAAPTETSSAKLVVAKATKEEVQKEEILDQESSSQKEEVINVVTKETQQTPQVHTPVERSVSPNTVDSQVAQDASQDRTTSVSPNESAPETRMDAKDQPTLETSPSVVDNEQPVYEDPFQTDLTNDILIPNAFSPQGDGVNDKLKIVAGEHERVDVRVFAAKTGSLVFRSNDLSNMWDGRLPNGNIAEEGYYSCVVLLTNKNGQTRVKSMVVQLFR